MDEYLIPNANLERMLKDWEKFGNLVIAFDFDNTVFDFHKKGVTYENMEKLLRELKEIGCYLICWTCKPAEQVVDYLIENNIPYDLINENPPFFEFKDSRKIYYNALLDDKAGLLQTYTELDLLVKLIKNK